MLTDNILPVLLSRTGSHIGKGGDRGLELTRGSGVYPLYLLLRDSVDPGLSNG